MIGYNDWTIVLSTTFFLVALIPYLSKCNPQPAEASSNDMTYTYIRCYMLPISCTLIQKKELSAFIYK